MKHVFSDSERRMKKLVGPHKRYTLNVPYETHTELMHNTARVRFLLNEFAAAERMKKCQTHEAE